MKQLRARLGATVSVVGLLCAAPALAQQPDTPPVGSGTGARSATPVAPPQSAAPPPAASQANPDPTPQLPAPSTAIQGGEAATSPQAVSQEVVVTGFRGSLNRAINTKRDSVGVVDSIKSEDIAAFPDLNLAESIQRIPGVSIARDAGEGRQITVRGLGPDFTRVRINGMEANATTGSSDSQGGNNRSRAFDFNVFASELFNDIHRAQDAGGRHRGGLAGRYGGSAHHAPLRLQKAHPRDLRSGGL